MRLIDEDALMTWLDNYYDDEQVSVGFVIGLIKDTPTIDALQGRPTGTWIVKQGNYCGVELKEFYCDQCMTRGALRRVFSDPEPLPNFCSNCGADMRGGADD